MTVDEFNAERRRLLREDVQYREEHERREAEHAERRRLDRIDEQSVLEDLRAIGVEVRSVWDIYRLPIDQRGAAIPVLLRHLERDHRPNVLEGLASPLANKIARPWWSDMKRIYLSTDDETARDRLAAALCTVAVRAHYDDLLSFVPDERLGGTRTYFLRPINRIDNRMSPGQGRAVVARFADHPDLGVEADAVLRGRGIND
ncbi:MAG TPA: hypothetical protein VJ872_20460 [Nocardioides sp.]|nr:hypothetical protein [Nocardioides sp.]